jgi:hypothetical protein
MNRLSIILALICCFILFTGESCEEREPSAEQKQTKQTNQVLDEINRQVGMPNLSNFQQKKLMKMVYELCDKEDLICFAYFKSDYQGKLVFIGKCIGFGVPFSAQFTNPLKIAKESHNYGYAILPQADPNGLYMPIASSATWLLMIDPKDNEPRPVYLEPEIIVSPFPLH